MHRSLAALLLVSIAETATVAEPCSGPVGAAEAVRCALAGSPDVRIAGEELRALAGSRTAARTLLPTNPALSFTGAGRVLPRQEAPLGGDFFNWVVQLSQEVEIGGQRGARVAVVDAQLAAATRLLHVARQEVASGVLAGWFDVVAAREAVALADEVDGVAQALGRLAESRLQEALISPVDADLVRAEAIRIRLLRLEAERRYAASQAVLGLLLGRGPLVAVEVAGTLDTNGFAPEAPLVRESLIERALSLRGEVAAAEMERAVSERRVALLRRERIPNPTLAVFVQNDGANERVYGGGVSLPIPLPSPLGRTLAGEIAEAEARVEQGRLSVERVQRRVRLEVAQAWQSERSKAEALQLFSPDFLARVRVDLRSIGEGLSARQLSVRESLLAERSLIDTIRADLDARLAYAQAWVELRRAAGVPLPGAGR